MHTEIGPARKKPYACNGQYNVCTAGHATAAGEANAGWVGYNMVRNLLWHCYP